MQPVPQHPASLLPGTLVGPWRILDWRGSGAFGVAYLAEGVAPQASGKVLLKLALNPWEARFRREATLLSRLGHPCVPRFIDQGQWLSPFGLPHPFLVMEWVHGLPLYVWARTVAPSSRQVLRVLADVARALEATHALGAAHRDVKGDNVLVRREDGRGLLVDFGSSTYPGAEPLTDGVFPPATSQYRSPEAYRFAARVLQSPFKQYSPGSADDLFALGVSGYRLVTGRYTPLPQDPKDPESSVWETGGPGPRPARELNPSCSPELSALICQMLSVQPEARGSARELAEALEQAAREAGPEADASLYSGRAPRPEEAEAASQHVVSKPLPPGEPGAASRPSVLRQPPLPGEAQAPLPRLDFQQPPPPEETQAPRPRLSPPGSGEAGRYWLAAAGLAGAMALGAAWGLSTTSGREEEAAQEQVAEQEESRDGGTVNLGDSVLTAPVDSRHEPFVGPPIAVDIPSKPLPGQARPDAQGRCRFEKVVPINGGCWLKVAEDTKDCAESEGGYVYKGACYVPFLGRQRPPTSSPTESRDGGR